MTEPDPDAVPPASRSVSDFAAATTSHAMLSGGAWNGLSHLIPHVYTVVQSVAAARFLGPEGMGRQSFIAWAALSVAFLWSRGLPDAVLRFAAESLGRARPGDVRALARWATRIEIAAALLGLLVLAGAGALRGEARLAWALAGFACATSIVRSIPLALLRAMGMWRASSFIGVVSGAVTMALTVGVLAAGGGIAGMFAVEAAVGLAATVYTRQKARAATPTEVEPVPLDPDMRKRVRGYAGVATFQAFFAFLVWQRSEFVLLDRYSGEREIAIYSVAFGGVAVLARVIQGFAAVVPGSVATLHGAGASDRIRSGFGRGLRLLVVATMPMGVLAAVLGPTLVRLVYGNEYARAGQVLVLLVAAVPAVALYHLGHGLLHGLGRLRLVLLASAAGTVADIGIGLLLVPDHGAVGAAIANASAQLTAAGVVFVAAWRAVGRPDIALTRIAAAALAAGLAGAVAWVSLITLGPLPGVLAGGLAGGVVYALVAVRIGALGHVDRSWLAAAVGARGGKWARRVLAVPTTEEGNA